MKKYISGMLTAAILLFVFTLGAFASNRVTDIDVTAVLFEDGSARITQVWNCEFNEGTECYLHFRTDRDMKVSDFSVSDGSTEYTYTENWDTDASFARKAYRCGINPVSDGVELCWGISDYGSNTYTLSYTVSAVVGSYADSDGFNFRFVNSGLNTTPTDVDITVSCADGTLLSEENAAIWAFGYEGYTQFENGSIVMRTVYPIDIDNNMTLLAEFDKGVFEPSTVYGTSFEKVKDKAFDGSDYRKGIGFEDIIQYIFYAVFALFVLCPIVMIVVNRIKISRFKKASDYFRDLPCNDNMDMTYTLGRIFMLCGDTDVVGAYILRLMCDGCVTTASRDNVGLLGKVKEENVIKLIQPPEDTSSNLYAVYDFLSKAAGSDGTLTPYEAEIYCKYNHEGLRRLIDSFEKDGKNVLRQEECFAKNKISSSVSKLTEKGLKNLSEITGFIKYMEDFSLIGERSLGEVDVWREYLVYAQIFGIADTVAKQLKLIIPDRIPDIEKYETNVSVSRSFNRSMYRTMHRREMAEKRRNSGKGGFSSIGGGGGFRGGGFRGGTR